MRVEITARIVVTDELGRHLATAEVTDRKDVGGNPRFFVEESLRVADPLAERVVLTAARGIDRERATERLGS